MDTTIVMWTKITSNRMKLPSIHALSSPIEEIPAQGQDAVRTSPDNVSQSSMENSKM